MAASHDQSQIASRYVTALFELAEEGGQTDAVSESLTRLASAIDGSAELQQVIHNPALSRDTQDGVMQALAAKDNGDALVNKFLGTLLANRRLALLPEIARQFELKTLERKGEARAIVTSAAPLSDQEQKSLQQALSDYTGKKVSLKLEEDASLIGGVRVMVDGKRIDASVAGQLDRMKDSLYHSIRNIA